MAKNTDTYIRKKGSNKKKETFNKYGKYTAKGCRHLEAIKENTRVNQQIEKAEK
tara:strand:- start:479 stop:640 length:162 start_codon:yes stop_codon:yes gene_type:complete